MHSQSWRIFRHMTRCVWNELKPFLHLCLLACRPHVSLSQALPWAFASWGIPPVRASGLAACSDDNYLFLGEPLTGYSVPPACWQTGMSIFRDRRSALYAAPLVSREYHVCSYYVAEWRRFPFGPAVCPLAISRSAGSNSRRLRAFVENPDHSHLFEASPLSASSLSPFCPCTPTFDSQSPAVGQYSLPFTWGVGVDEQYCSSHLIGHTVVQGSSN